MKVYDYLDRNLLENPQNYSYASVDGTLYLDEWKRKRNTIIRSIKPAEGSPISDLVLEYKNDTQLSPTGQQLLNLIFSVMNDPVISPSIEAQLQLWVKRFEVKKKLFLEYDDKKINGNVSNYSCGHNYILFSYLLLQCWKKIRKLQYLNCFLKLNDTICSIRSILTNNEKQILYWQLTQESKIVDELAGDC